MTDETISAGLAPSIIEALRLVCYTLAAARDAEPLPDGWIKALKYEVVDRALESILPGFDGGATSPARLAESLANYRATMDAAKGGA